MTRTKNSSLIINFVALMAGLLGSAACASTMDKDGSSDPASPAGDGSSSTDAGDRSGPPIASCTYENAFTSAEECRHYTGSTWTLEGAQGDCESDSGQFVEGSGCSFDAELGACTLNGGTGSETVLVFPGSDEGECDSARLGCEVFAGGVFEARESCGGEASSPPAGIGSQGSVYTVGPLECVTSPDDNPGLTDGEICTRSMIGGCTEPGRKFEDYASCEPVLTQRPYYPRPAAAEPAGDDDPRLEDSEYMGELAWLKEQVESCGCVCCHSDNLAPEGASNWDIEAGPLWIDTFWDTGLAMGAGWVSSESLGAFPKEDNNGFSREVAGLPTTDEARMISLFESELARRGRVPSDFDEVDPFGGPIYTQSLFVPEACASGEGVDAGGIVTWGGGAARYVFVMLPGSKNPGAPPNLDKPEGTLWKVQVGADDEPLLPGIQYGVAPNGGTQTVPNTSSSVEELEVGQQYYLYVQADVGIPITRCLFTYDAN